QISAMAESPEWDVYSVRVRDRFGDNGIVGVVIVHDGDDVRDIDTFLLSCRVISRGVETSILSFLVERARTRQLRYVQGWFLPTKKNAPARNCSAAHHMLPLAPGVPGSRSLVVYLRVRAGRTRPRGNRRAAGRRRLT